VTIPKAKIEELRALLTYLGGVSPDPAPPFKDAAEWARAVGPGAWRAVSDPTEDAWNVEEPDAPGMVGVVARHMTEEVARFLAAAREALPALLDEVERIERERDAALVASGLGIAAWLRAELTSLVTAARAAEDVRLADTLETLAGGLTPGLEHPAVALLREVEWGGQAAEQEGSHICPSCGAYGGVTRRPVDGEHTPDCRLYALLHT
jgi:hypothetical protein